MSKLVGSQLHLTLLSQGRPMTGVVFGQGHHQKGFLSGYKSVGSFEMDKRGISGTAPLSLPLRRGMEPVQARMRSWSGSKGGLPKSETPAGILAGLLRDLPVTNQNKLRIASAFLESNTAAISGDQKEGKISKGIRYLQQLLSIASSLAILVVVGVGGCLLYNLLEKFKETIGKGNVAAAIVPAKTRLTFGEVKGVDEAKAELKEVIQFLRNPRKFAALGGKLPKGILLVGPPGTGKTMLAKAVAGEANVPFFYMNGSEFEQIFVGVGAARVRALFNAAKASAPCVIFIDEIDSVGSTRTHSTLNPYANQVINQLLAEMDGFTENKGVIVIGATNRRNVLDKALLRPGRFDTQVYVQAPDLKGRRDILRHYLGKVKCARDIDVDKIARATTGFTGAALANLVNQAALRAASENARAVGEKHLEFAREKSSMGVERKSMVLDDKTKWNTACHEAGHALVAIFTKEATPVNKVTIIPRGHSLGHTSFLPEKEKHQQTRAQLLAMMDTLMGGRAAEELLLGIDNICTGVHSDLQRATIIATHMVKSFGMSDIVGLRTFEGNSIPQKNTNSLAPSTSEMIDTEIQRYLQDSYDRAKKILTDHAEEHKALAQALLANETLDSEAIKAIIAQCNQANT